MAEPATLEVESELFWKAFRCGDADDTGVLMGEAAGTIRSVSTAAEILEAMVAQAHQLLRKGSEQIAV